jgi:hypothetical protein
MRWRHGLSPSQRVRAPGGEGRERVGVRACSVPLSPPSPFVTSYEWPHTRWSKRKRRTTSRWLDGGGAGRERDRATTVRLYISSAPMEAGHKAV